MRTEERTEDELRAAIQALADTAPADALARLQLPPDGAPAVRIRHVGRLVLAAVLVVVVAAVGIAWWLRPSSAAPADRRVSGYWQLISRIEPPAGWRVVGQGIEGTSEYTEVATGTRTDDSCSVRVYGRGQLPGGLPTGRSVRVGEHPGSYTPATDVDPATVTWAYDENAYARIGCLGDRSVAVLLALAVAVRFDAAADLAVPFRLGGLPAGYRAASVQVFERDGQRQAGVLLKGDGLPTIGVGNSTTTFDPPGPGLPGVEELQINGRATTVREDQRALSIMVGGRYLIVSSYVSEGQSWLPGQKEGLLAVAQGLQPARDLADPGTWFTARQALG